MQDSSERTLRRGSTGPWGGVVLLVGVALGMMAGSGVVAGARPGGVEAGGPPELEQTQAAFQRVIAEMSPSVVSLRVQRRSVLGGLDGLSGFDQLVIVNGSGAIISEDGLILTNEHVVQSASEIEVIFSDGRVERAGVLAADPRSDLAILRTPRQGLPALRFCDWERVARGQWTIVLGNPYGLAADGSLSSSVGVIANLGRRLPGLGEVDDRLYTDMIQTTAAINPGNSGGPLLNIRGELIGVVTAMHTRAAADEGIGFAIALTPGKRRIIERLVEGRGVEYGYIGLTARLADGGERSEAHLPENIGVVVTRVEPEGPAARAGIRLGDIITAFGDVPVSGPAQLVEAVGAAGVGSTVAVEVVRDGERLRVESRIERREISRVGWMRGEALLWRGLRIADLSGPIRQRLGLDPQVEGVVILEAVAAGQRDEQVRPGDVIEAVGDEPVGSVDAFRRMVASRSGVVQLRVRERGVVALEP